MTVQLSPGVVITEIDLSLYAPAIATTIVGMVGTCARGPLNTAVTVTNENQLVSTFGVPSPEHKAIYAARQYLKFGNQLVFVRVAGEVRDSITLIDPAGDDTLIVEAVDAGTTFGDLQVGVSTPGAPGTFNMTVYYRGLVVESFGPFATKAAAITAVNANSAYISLTDADDGNSNPPEKLIDVLVDTITGVYEIGETVELNPTPGPATGTGVVRSMYAIGTGIVLRLGALTGTIADADVAVGGTSGASGTVMTQVPAQLTLTDGTPAYAFYNADDGQMQVLVSSIAGGTFAVGDALTFGGGGTAVATVVEAVGTANLITFDTLAGTLNFTGAIDNGTATGVVIALNDVWSLRVVGSTPGSWANGDLRVTFEAGSDASSFRILVEYRDGVVEVWDNLVMTPTTAEEYVETVVNGNSQYITVVHNIGNDNQPAFGGPYGLQGGNDGYTTIQSGDYIGTEINGIRSGLKVFNDAEELDLNILAVPGVSAAAVIAEMDSICRTRGDCMAIVDPPFGLTRDGVIKWHNGLGSTLPTPPPESPAAALNSSYMALYWGWVKVYDPYNDGEVWIPPSGHVAGVYAYTDTVTAPWFAPAGLNRAILRDVLALEPQARTTLGDRELLYAGGRRGRVNPIVNFTGIGITIWGQRTLQVASTALDRVNVRRMLLYLRKVISSVVLFLTFEPNDPATWKWFENLVEPVLLNVKRRRGVRDYLVLCDASTNPPDVTEQNRMVGKVFIVPTKVAEVIEVQFIILPQGANFQEFIALAA